MDQNPPQRIGGGLQPAQGTNLGGALSTPAATTEPVLSPSFIGGPSGGSTTNNSTSGGGLTPVPLPPLGPFTSNQNASIGQLLRMDPTGGLLQVQLPPASAGAGQIGIKVQSNSGNGVVIVPNGGDTIDGVAGNYPNSGGLGGRERVTLYSDGVSDWMVMA